MKLKKFLAAAIASAVIAAGAASVSALNDGEATYCFDTNAAMADWQTYGSVTETGTKTDQTTHVSKNGNGSLLVSVNVADEIENKFGGFYVDAATFGLENFKGCTMEM
ncbi:MAG: hypothetical protein K2J72_12375, partial [Oscillospiraceae bacterium]|nr:hypothetical protein [Oscillospiraceae bacterium]